ncbi:hypothetical protein SAMD00019534_024750 [Acytostelium subglobosum LB1]|uniref:hypothetical protein n=1 Tax=Acytostelium subglobosum LB1 TaxID=1410327 RepID=UPI0006449689|nr:hypothetical protein SAMD00019534_024750 [Acytostelium subglobosum LB1]GAM19300.1 hypothetical protein SAMD00019534_024750 [Acytostelium subglobosum LB1]|eukprot:XP_012757227.1 hypothetical protein SAMD00019534_024750 [Acytostelium subglobosum LB1]
MSIDLIDRLLAHPNFRCRFNHVLGSAIVAGNKEVIDMMLGPLPKDTPIRTFYRYALRQAALVGDLDNIKKIMIISREELTVYDIGSLIDRVGVYGSLVTDDVVMELAKSKSIESQIYTLFTKAASKSTALFRFVMERISSNDLLHKINIVDINTAFEACVNRGDNESLEQVVQLARTACSTSALNHLFDYGHYSVDDNKSLQLMDWACENGKLDIMRMIHQRCTTPTQLQRLLPSMKAIHCASDNNHHKLLSYLFEGDVDVDGPTNPRSQTVFQRAESMINITMLIRVVRLHSCANGHLRIIDMCDRLLAQQPINQ